VVHDLVKVVALLFLSLCAALGIDDMVLNFCLIVFQDKKHHPWIRRFDWRSMDHRLFDGLSLAFGSTMMSSTFSGAAKTYAPKFYTAMVGYTHRWERGITAPYRIEHWDMSSTRFDRCLF
jgi:hypothetical protein